MLYRVLLIGVCVFLSFPLAPVSYGMDFQRAKEYVEKAINLGSTPSDLKIKEAYYIEALNLCHSFAKAHNNLGDVYEKQGKLDKAIKQYKKIIKLSPNVPTPYFGIADILFKRDKIKDAKEWYEEGQRRERKGKYDEQTLMRLATIKDREKHGTIQSETMLGIWTKTRGASKMISISFGEALIPFDSGKHYIKADAKPQLNEIGKTLEKVFKNDDIFVEIAGHTDNNGTDEYNLKLSTNRAGSVMEYLIREFKIPKARLRASGYGKRKRLCATEDSEECHTVNRRIEIVTE